MFNDIVTLVDLLVLILEISLMLFASWRLAFMLVNEDGNMSITYAIRLLGTKPTNENVSRWMAWKRSLVMKSGITPTIVTNNLGKMLSCIWCTTVTTSVVWATTWYFYSTEPIYQVITLGFAVSGLVFLYNEKLFS